MLDNPIALQRHQSASTIQQRRDSEGKRPIQSATEKFDGVSPECVLDLIDLPETGTVDWDALGFGCREPFYTSTLKTRRKAAKTGMQKQVARAA